MLLRTRYEKHRFSGWKLAKLQRQFPHVTSYVNEVDIITGIKSAYLGHKVTTNQAEDMSIKYRTNIINTLKEAGKIPAAMHIHNM